MSDHLDRGDKDIPCADIQLETRLRDRMVLRLKETTDLLAVVGCQVLHTTAEFHGGIDRNFHVNGNPCRHVARLDDVRDLLVVHTAIILHLVPASIRKLFVIKEAGESREELWVELKSGSLAGNAFVAPAGQTFEEWAKRIANKLTKGAGGRLKPAEPPSMVFGPDVKATEAWDAPAAKRTFMKLDVPKGTNQIGDIKVQRKAPKEPQEGPASCRKIEFTKLPPKARFDWQEFWIRKLEEEGATQTDPTIKMASNDPSYDPSQDAIAGKKETVFAISGEGHAAALVDGKEAFFYDDGWVDGASNEAANVQGFGLLGLAGYDVRRLMPPPNPRFLQPGMVPPGMPGPGRGRH